MDCVLREPVRSPEFEVIDTRVIDLSGLEPWFVASQVEFLRGRADKIVALPDLGPTQPGIVPTGSVVEFNANRYPEWLKHVRGADIGCGMLLATFDRPIRSDDFERDQGSLNGLYSELGVVKDRAALGGGNHFMDFARTGDNEVAVIIHTGSFGDRQVELGKLVKQMEESGRIGEVDLYMRQYRDVVAAGEANRLELLAAVERIYGKAGRKTDLIHNTIKFEQKSGRAVVYKGAINVTSVGEGPLFLPSSMADVFVLYEKGNGISEDTCWAAPHGTGRAVARGDVDKATYISLYGDGGGKVDAGYLSDIQPGARLMVPTGMGLPVTELPFVYRKVDRTLDIMESRGLMGRVVDIWQPLAYIGHI